MGKSPGRWLKSLLFGKKSRSHAKGRGASARRAFRALKVFSWLDRWTSTSFWQPNSKSKKVIDSKGQTNRDNCNMGTESGKSRRSIRTNPAWNIGGGQTNPKYEPERTKRNQKKVPNPPAETVQRHPQSELERVKRNLRKISSTAIKDASEQPEVDTLDQRIEESIDKPEENINTIPNIKADTETALEPVTAGPVDVLLIDDNEDSTLMMNGELSLMEEQFCHENQKTSKTRSSFSAKSEYTDTPVLPSYMSTTESAKAKLRGQVSPRIVSESVDIRRHSLPSSTTNGNMSSSTTKRLIQTGGKGGIGRDVNDRIRPSVNKAATPKRKEMADWERKAERGKRVTLCMKGEKICKSKKTRRSKIGRTDGGRERRKVPTSGTESRCSDSEERRAVF
ncbi:hypothetical protein BHE74_00001044 [Ensete ventricosum]|nr:hypothetical protein BHE74_00001044 [Ensete ventricosum]